jgi:hypothetical protein
LTAVPSFPDTDAYWLEDDRGERVSKLFRTIEKPLKLAGRVLENVGSTQGWAIARRTGDGARHVVAADDALETLARPFLPERTPEEREIVERFNEAKRRDPNFPSRAAVETDSKVY